jgi:hypothetical protein
MLRLFRRSLLTLAATALCVFAFGASAASSDVGLQTANLACNDGTSTNLTVDPATLQDLTNSVAAMALYPAGMNCSVSPTMDPSGSNGPQDFAVGGGQFVFQGCKAKFAVSAHSPDSETPTTDASGTANLSVPNSSACMASSTGEGTLVTKVDCLSVNGNTADFTAVVTHSTGMFLGSLPPGQEAAWEVKDLHPLAPDEVQGTTTDFPCEFFPQEPGFVDHGQITVRDN